MLLGDAHVEAALREGLRELVETGSRRHGGGDRHDLVIHLGLRDQGLGEDVLIGHGLRRRLVLLAGNNVELRHAVVLVRGRLRRFVALALLGDAVDQHGTVVVGVTHVL